MRRTVERTLERSVQRTLERTVERTLFKREPCAEGKGREGKGERREGREKGSSPVVTSHPIVTLRTARARAKNGMG